ncbi:MAG: WS/DGAT/MGAT family O-acyltransferase [Pseudomonadales bacterium]
MKRLEGMDAVFLHTESPTQYMHTLKIAIFDAPEDGAAYSFQDQLAHIASTIHRVPPFRWKALSIPLNIHHPLWMDDPDFDLALHVHRAALPAPAGEKELSEFIENIASTPLNRDRALWELWMVEGYQGDKVAAVSKVHHALADGVGTAELLEDFMTRKPGEDVPASTGSFGEQVPTRAALAWSSVKDLVRDLGKIPGQIGRIRAAKKRREARNLPLQEQPPEPYTGPFTLLNGPLSSHRKFTFFTVPLEDIKLIRKAFNTTINDVVLNMVAQALREYLQTRNALPSEPRNATVPVSTRAPEKVHTYGNKVGSLCVSLCTDIEDTVQRLPAIHRAVEASKLEFEDTKGGRAADFVGLLPPMAVRAIGSYSRRLSEQGKSPSFNVIVSNVPGPRQQLYDDYLPMREFYSIGPVLEGVGLNITAWSFRDNLSFSVLSCYRAVPEPNEIRDSLLCAMQTMKTAALASTREDEGESKTVPDDEAPVDMTEHGEV